MIYVLIALAIAYVVVIAVARMSIAAGKLHRDPEEEIEEPRPFTWDQLQAGDVLTLHFSTSQTPIPILLLETDRDLFPVEEFRSVCICSVPSCPRIVDSINVRRVMGTGDVDVFRDGRVMHRATGGNQLCRPRTWGTDRQAKCRRLPGKDEI